MNDKERFVILKAFERVVKDASKDVAADVKAQLIEEGNAGVKVLIGGERVTVNLYTPSSTEYVGTGEEFVSFMRDHGMTHEVVSDEWKQCVVVAGDKVLWEETGEVVPGVYVQVVQKADFIKCERMNARKVLFAARDAGMLDGATVQMLEGEQ